MSRDQSQREPLLGLLAQKMGGEHIVAMTLLQQAVGERLGLNTTDLTCLFYLNDANTLTAGQLAGITGLTTGSVTIVIDRLEKADYVRREKDDSDRRRVLVRPNSERIQHDLAPLYAAIGDAWVQTLDQYSAEELGTILDMLTRSALAVREQIADLRRGGPVTSAPARTVHASAKPLNGLVASQARLTFANGLWNTLIVGAQLPTLYRGTFESPEPRLTTTNGVAHLTIRSAPLPDPQIDDAPPSPRVPGLPFFGLARPRGAFTLNTTTTWQIEIRAGASRSRLDLRHVPLASFSVTEGMHKVELLLGRPTGTVPITLLGGTADVAISRPEDVAVKLRIERGATGVRLDKRHEHVVYDDHDWYTPDYADAIDRYEITVNSGVSKLRIIGEK